MDEETHLRPEQRIFACADCGHRVTDSNRPFACPRCGETMRNDRG